MTIGTFVRKLVQKWYVSFAFGFGLLTVLTELAKALGYQLPVWARFSVPVFIALFLVAVVLGTYSIFQEAWRTGWQAGREEALKSGNMSIDIDQNATIGYLSPNGDELFVEVHGFIRSTGDAVAKLINMELRDRGGSYFRILDPPDSLELGNTKVAFGNRLSYYRPEGNFFLEPRRPWEFAALFTQERRTPLEETPILHLWVRTTDDQGRRAQANFSCRLHKTKSRS